jgi:hypothetical protein
VDPEFLTADDIATVLPNGATCRFAYTGGSPAVLVTGEDADGPAALIKISGDLVRLAASDVGADVGTFEASPLRAVIEPTDDDHLHDLVIGAGPEYEAGFRGLFACSS